MCLKYVWYSKEGRRSTKLFMLDQSNISGIFNNTFMKIIIEAVWHTCIYSIVTNQSLFLWYSNLILAQNFDHTMWKLNFVVLYKIIVKVIYFVYDNCEKYYAICVYHNRSQRTRCNFEATFLVSSKNRLFIFVAFRHLLLHLWSFWEITAAF